MPSGYYVSGYYAYRLAILIKTRFIVATAGEYLFSPSFGSYTSAGLFVDGAVVAKTDKWNSSTSNWDLVEPTRSIYLLPGEHELVVKLGQSRTGRSAYETSFSLAMRGPDGNTVSVGGANFYTIK